MSCPARPEAAGCSRGLRPFADLEGPAGCGRGAIRVSGQGNAVSGARYQPSEGPPIQPVESQASHPSASWSMSGWLYWSRSRGDDHPARDTMILDVLTDIPPFQQFAGMWNLCCLANVDWIVSG